MTVRKALAIGGLLFLLTSLASALHVYDARQQAIELEGNRLYSTESFTVTGNAHDILAEAADASEDLRVLKDVTDGGQVRVVLAEDRKNLGIPVYTGRQFSRGNTREALVGSGVPVTARGGVEYYSFEGRDYEVVGRLGAQADSLLAQDILLSDPALFAVDEDEPLVVDGEGAFDAYVAHFGSDGTGTMYGGTSHRTNVDFVSPLLLLFGTCIVLVGLVCTGLLANALLRRHTHVLHVLGVTHPRIFASAIVWLLGLWVSATAMSTAIWHVVMAGASTTGSLLLTDLAWQGAAVMAAFAIAFVATRRGGTLWS